jgi:hypothetical protein
MRRLQGVILPGMIIGSLYLQIGCQAGFKPGIPDQTYTAKLISGAEFVRTYRGEYLDGYLIEADAQFQRQLLFMALETQKYVRDERLIVTGKLTGDFVRMSFKDRIDAEVPVFRVYRAAPNIPSSPNIPVLK